MYILYLNIFSIGEEYRNPGGARFVWTVSFKTLDMEKEVVPAEDDLDRLYDMLGIVSVQGKDFLHKDDEL